MDPYNIIMGLVLLLVGGISIYLIIVFKRKKDSKNRMRDSFDHNDLWLYIAAIGGIIGGFVAILREFLKL